MRLENITATAHPDGHRIDLAWVNPRPASIPGMRIVRRSGRHPSTPEDGDVVFDGSDLHYETDEDGRAHFAIQDGGLKELTVYYYSLFPYAGAPPNFQIDRANRVAAMATAVYNKAGRMFSLMPSIYHRYAAEDGQLQRFLGLPGGQLDLLQSYARSLLDLHDIQRVDGRLLPLLAQWIGWETDYGLALGQQRREIRNAPSIYKRVGLIPVVGATVERISGWESRAKEFVHNVARSNKPPRLNLWAHHAADDGTMLSPDALLSLDFAYGGRPTLVQDDHGVRRLFYHTMRRGRSRLWYKTSPTFHLSLDAQPHLESDDVSALQRSFAAAGVEIAADATISAAGSLWHVDDSSNGQTYVVEPGSDEMTVFHTSADLLAMAPSRLLDVAGTTDDMHPAAALQGETLWIFWSAYNAAADRWEIRYRTRRDGTWSADATFIQGAADPVPERRHPRVVTDADDGLWLFWHERVGRRWRLRYNRHDGTALETDPTAGWQLDPSASFPLDTTGGPPARDPRVDDDVFLLYHPNDTARRLWIFWARKEPTGDPSQTRWSVAYRIKAGTDPTDSDWGEVALLPKTDVTDHAREPAATIVDGDVAVYWSSDSGGGWSIWRGILGISSGSVTLQGGSVERLTPAAYVQRDPLPLAVGDDTVLIYRSNERIGYGSHVYRATETWDYRYAGSSTIHSRHGAQLETLGTFEDAQTYTFDAGTSNEDWYRRDTLGLYLQPDTMDPELVTRGLERLANVLPEFMPATDRAVLITQSDLHAEHVYTYDVPGLSPRLIVEDYADTLSSALDDSVLGPDEDFTDNLE